MADEPTQASSGFDLEKEKLAFERYKATLDFWKTIVISGLVAVVIVAIPPSFQYATAQLDALNKGADGVMVMG